MYIQDFIPTIILRHRKENLKKCSLRGLEERADCEFFTYPKDTLPDLTGYVLLTLDAPLLSEADSKHGLFLVDGTWRHTEKMLKTLGPMPGVVRRQLPPGLRTAYPRRQDDCVDPDAGLASVEALYAAYVLTGRDPTGLLDHYHWRDQFLELNGYL